MLWSANASQHSGPWHPTIPDWALYSSDLVFMFQHQETTPPKKQNPRPMFFGETNVIKPQTHPSATGPSTTPPSPIIPGPNWDRKTSSFKATLSSSTPFLGRDPRQTSQLKQTNDHRGRLQWRPRLTSTTATAAVKGPNKSHVPNRTDMCEMTSPAGAGRAGENVSRKLGCHSPLAVSFVNKVPVRRPRVAGGGTCGYMAPR